MTINIELLDSNKDAEYRDLVEACSWSVFNHSLKYKNLLGEILSNSEDRYLGAFNQGELIAALPLFVKRGDMGSVVNSLPFFGSVGGLIAKSELTKDTINALLHELENICIQNEAISCTIVENPFDKNKELYNLFESNIYDERIAQITTLPSEKSKIENRDALMNLLHGKTRNMVRKGSKAGFSFSEDDSLKALKKLHEIHVTNMLDKGGLSKSYSVFERIRKNFDYGEEYRIYTAEKEGEIVAAILVFYFKDMVEYFTPAVDADHRSEQPLSYLIFNAMVDSISSNKSRLWNWGGTWVSQDTLYRFKSRWGATDQVYRYHIKTFVDFNAKKYTRTDLMNQYHNFYTIPFSALHYD